MRGLPVAVAMLLLIPGEASAHLVSTRFGELYSGMLHPVTTLQHLVPWLALGLLCGLQETHTARWALIVFPASVFAGVVLAGFEFALPYTAGLNLLSFVALGLLVLFKARLWTPLFLATAVMFGISHGHANGAPELNGFGAFLYASGVTLAAYLVVTLVAAATQALVESRGWGHTAVRAVGSWITAAGLIYGGFVFISS